MQVQEKRLETGYRNVWAEIKVRLERGCVGVSAGVRHMDGGEADPTIALRFEGPKGGYQGSAAWRDPGLLIQELRAGSRGLSAAAKDTNGNRLSVRDGHLILRGPRGHLRSSLPVSVADVADIAAAVRFVWEACE